MNGDAPPDANQSNEHTDAAADADAGTNATPAPPTPLYGTTEDARSLAAAADAIRADRESDRTIHALRAATTAAGTQPTLAQITEVRRLHEATIEAARHPRRFGSKASARRHLENAIARRAAALREIGFNSFEEFSDVYGPTLTLDRTEPETDDTIARICELLIELGVNPTADPLRAASEFLTAHEAELLAPAPAQPEVAAESPPRFERANASADVRDAPADAEPPAAVEAPWIAAAQLPVPEPASDDVPASPPPSVAPDAPAPSTPEPARADGDVVDRWISAEARAERMHAEVERAQAELGAMLARSADLEETADARVDELETANAQLRIARARVEELEAAVAGLEQTNAGLLEAEAARYGADTDHAHTAAELELAKAELERARDEIEQTKQRADAEHADLERALTAGRDRVTELETSVANRERALAEAEQSRATAREALTGREDELASNRVELDEARARVTEIEAELAGAVATQAAELAQARARVTELEAELETAVAAHAAEVAQARARTDQLESELTARTAALDEARSEQRAAATRTEELAAELETTRRSLEALDAHAEQVEAQLATARRAIDSLDVRRELDALRKELAEARHELGHLEVQRAETDRALAHDRLELQQLQRTLMTMRDQAVTANTELTEAREAIDDARLQAEAAERARDAITVDAADLLARAEAEASSVLERANRDAEAIRQQAMLTAETAAPAGERPSANGNGYAAEDAIRGLADQVGRLERKLAKQRRRLDRLTGKRGDDAPQPGRSHTRRATPDAASDVIATAEREAAEIRREARRDRDRFREELVTLLSRFAPLDDD